MYWKQQRGYGRAEALLERKWPEKYNAPGHLSWAGRMYGRGLLTALRWRAGRIYQGHAGTAPFQSIYEPASGPLSSLPMMPEWHLAVLALLIITALGVFWTPLFLAAPLLLIGLAVPVGLAGINAIRASFHERDGIGALTRRLLTCGLHLVQPVARLSGRLEFGLTPWRHRGRGLVLPLPRVESIWREEWHSPEARTHQLASLAEAPGGQRGASEVTSMPGTSRYAAGCSRRRVCFRPSKNMVEAASSCASDTGRDFRSSRSA